MLGPRARPAETATAARAGLSAAELAIARSVLYASLFDYPLTLAQLRQTLIESEQTASEIVATYGRSDALKAVIAFRDGFFFPQGRHGLVAERSRRDARSRAFLRGHRHVLALISRLPFVGLVALSGSIAHLNLDGPGDLDLFIVTRGPRVWSVTVAVVLLAKLLGRRRTLCANFVVSDRCLELEQQDLFAASQIIHLKPLVGADVFRRFVAANPFVAAYYPNFHPADGTGFARRRGIAARLFAGTLEALLAVPSLAAEALCRRAYRAHLRRRAATWQSPEQVRLQDECLKLHTQSHRQSVMERFEDAVKQMEAGGSGDGVRAGDLLGRRAT